MAELNPTTPYRLWEFHTPSHAPFEPGPTQWPTIVAEFLAPIFRNEPDAVYWFVNHGADFQLCFATSVPDRLAQAIRARQASMRVATKKEPDPAATVAGAFGGSRWAGERAGTPHEPARSVLSLQFMHAACKLYENMLVQQGPHWRRESNTDGNNPCGSAFESLFHLVANLSQTDVMVSVYAATPFMQPAGANVPVRL